MLKIPVQILLQMWSFFSFSHLSHCLSFNDIFFCSSLYSTVKPCLRCLFSDMRTLALLLGKCVPSTSTTSDWWTSHPPTVALISAKGNMVCLKYLFEDCIKYYL